MYSLRNIFMQQPAAITAAILSILNTLVILSVLNLTAVQLAAIEGTLLLLLHLFYVKPLVASRDGLAKLAAAEKKATKPPRTKKK